MPVDTLHWVTHRYLTGPDPVVDLDSRQAALTKMMAEGKFRGFGKLHRVVTQEFGEEPKTNWRTTRGNDDPGQDTG